VSLKDELKYVKEELSSDEKLLESAFKLERFYKKNRLLIWSVLMLLIVGFGGKALLDVYRDHLEFKANEALLRLENNPSDKAALLELKESNLRLYELYLYSKGVDQREIKLLKSLQPLDDSLLKDISDYHKAVLSAKPGDSQYYHDLSLLERAYEALKAGKKNQARSQLSLIGENSPVAKIARLLRHATL